MDYISALNELLQRHHFRRHGLLRNNVGQLQLTGQLQGRAVDILLDTGAASTVVDLNYCRREGIVTRDTGKLGGGAGGLALPIHALDGAVLELDRLPLKSDGIYAVDLSHVNQGLTARGANPVHGTLGADILTYHRAVIDYATMSLFLQHGEPEPESR
jgi:hypothetical protein